MYVGFSAIETVVLKVAVAFDVRKLERLVAPAARLDELGAFV